MDALRGALAQIDPDTELRFFVQADNQSSYKAYLTITNVSQGNVAYKVKTTSPRFYVVKPNQGIIDKGDKIIIDITMIPSPENKVEDNKFLVQVAACDLLSSETYQLTSYWEKLPKQLSLSYKLKVSIAKTVGQQNIGGSVPLAASQNQTEMDTAPSFRQQADTIVSHQQPQANSSPVDRRQSAMQTSGVQSSQFVSQDNAMKSSVVFGGQANKKHEYERAPDDQINESLSQSLSQSQVVNQDQIKRKTDEVKQQLDQVLSQKQKIQQELTELKNKHIEDEKENYDWQQPDSKNEFRFQLIHLLITAIICLFIGGYLGARDTSIAAGSGLNIDLSLNQTADLKSTL